MSTLISLPQLTSATNFKNWKFGVQIILEEKQIDEALEKTKDDYSDKAKKQEFLLKDAKAKGVIVQCLTDKHLDSVKDAKTAKEIMEALQGVFERKN